jgi:hypothetical protein
MTNKKLVASAGFSVLTSPQPPAFDSNANSQERSCARMDVEGGCQTGGSSVASNPPLHQDSRTFDPSTTHKSHIRGDRETLDTVRLTGRIYAVAHRYVLTIITSHHG